MRPSDTLSSATVALRPAAAVPAARLQVGSVARALSLDVVAGILAAAWLVARVAAAPMPVSWFVALAASTWTIYALDHLADARRPQRPAPSLRHRFFQRHTRVLTVAACAGASLAATAAAAMPAPLLRAGFVPAVLAAMHLAWIRRSSAAPPKELAVAAIYALAIWYGPFLLRGPGAPSTVQLVSLATAHGAAALANLLLISLVERSLDLAGGQRSWVVEWGTVSARRALAVCGAVGLAAAGLAIAAQATRTGLLAGPVVPAAIAFAALAGAPFLLRARAEAANDPERVRAFSDLAFLVLAVPPAVALLAG